MVADYTEEEKAKILNKVTLYGAGSALSFTFVIIMYAFNICAKSRFLDDMFMYLLFFGAFCGISTVISGMQLTGRVKKDRLKKTAKILVPVFIAATVVISAILFILMSI